MLITAITGIDLTLIEVVTRNDDVKHPDQVNIYNKKLNNLCTERNCGLIKRDKITKSHLNNYGLHSSLKPKRNNDTCKELKIFFRKSDIKLKSGCGQE